MLLKSYFPLFTNPFHPAMLILFHYKNGRASPSSPEGLFRFSLVILLNDMDMSKQRHLFSLEVLYESVGLFDYEGHSANLF